MPRTRWVLVHSPIVGPDTWEPVAEELRSRRCDVLVPELPRTEQTPHATRHVDAVVAEMARWSTALDGEAQDTSNVHPVTLVAGHSGAGQLLPAIADGSAAVSGLLFVDAGIPAPGRSRLEQLRDESPDFAEEVAALFAQGERFPAWPEELLDALVPDPARRTRLREGIRRLPWSYWEEPLPMASSEGIPCAALLLSSGYEATRAHAENRGWPRRDLGVGNHFQLVVQPGEVVASMLELAEELLAAG